MSVPERATILLLLPLAGGDITALGVLPMPSPTRTHHVLYQLVLLTAFAGLLLLFALAQFGQQPPEQLPVAATIFWGLLVGAAATSTAARFSRAGLAGAVIVSAALNAVLALTLPSFTTAEWWYVFAPLAGNALVLVLLTVFRRYHDMLSAMAIYIICTVLANYTLDSFLPIGSFFLINVGTFFFGVTFTQRDRVHAYGRKSVYAMIGVAAVVNVFAALAVDTPLRYVAVAFLTIIVSETADTEVYQRLLHRPWIERVAKSNAVSAPIDSILFTVLAFAGESFATFGWMVQVIVTDIIVKYTAGMIVALGVIQMLRRANPFDKPESPQL